MIGKTTIEYIREGLVLKWVKDSTFSQINHKIFSIKKLEMWQAQCFGSNKKSLKL
jgi:hypothetical protein